ncbi:MAG: LytTR family transcriptional regulator [Oscillospiraceae bacterium]|nr:LytTR family transcriptional regulator [Oscillospiraceae bacterium]
MKFTLIIDKDKDEEVVATVHERSALVGEIEALILKHSGSDRIPGYTEDDIKMLTVSEIECVTVLDGKTYAIDSRNQRYRLKLRLYELEQQLPSSFIRINKSTLANESRLDRFAVTYAGSVDAVFKCGYREYVSRRCFAQIKRRFAAK